MLNRDRTRLTPEDLNARLRFAVGLTLAGVLAFTMGAVLYSLIYVTQPMEQSPNDKAFFDLITPIATFLVGTLSGVMVAGNNNRKDKTNETDSST
jgi:hypothetical protein